MHVHVRRIYIEMLSFSPPLSMRPYIATNIAIYDNQISTLITQSLNKFGELSNEIISNRCQDILGHEQLGKPSLSGALTLVWI